jgi:hypothetical protein
MGKGTQLRLGHDICLRWDLSNPGPHARVTHITFIPYHRTPAQDEPGGPVLTLYFTTVMAMGGDFDAKIMTLPGVSAPWRVGEIQEHKDIHSFVTTPAGLPESSGTAPPHGHILIADKKTAQVRPDDWFSTPSTKWRITRVLQELQSIIAMMSSAELNDCLAYFKLQS